MQPHPRSKNFWGKIVSIWANLIRFEYIWAKFSNVRSRGREHIVVHKGTHKHKGSSISSKTPKIENLGG